MITNETNSYLVILIYGSLVLLSFLLIANPLRVNNKANFWFGFFLFLWSTFWLEEIFNLINTNLLNGIPLIWVRFFQFLTPIVFYLSVVYYTNPDYKFKKTDLKYLLLPIVFLAGLITQYLNIEFDLIENLLNILIIIQAIYFTTTSYFKLNQHKKKIELFSSNTTEINLNWLEYIIIALIILSIFIGLYNALFVGTNLNLFANIVSLIIVLFVAYNTLKQKEIFLLNENQRNLIINANQEIVSSKQKVISDQNLRTLKRELLEIMENQEPFLDPELSLVRLSEQMNITPHQLSYVINSGFKINFFQFVNRYRVKKVKGFLLDKEKAHLSIMGMAFESGFNSKTSFNTTFKKICSQTPSEFKKSSSSL